MDGPRDKKTFVTKLYYDLRHETHCIICKWPTNMLLELHSEYISGCVGSSFLCEGFLQLWQVGATLHCGARASHCRGLSCCGAQAPDAQAQQLWLTGPVAPWHVGSSQTRARTRVPCIGRQILNDCATREAPIYYILTLKYDLQKRLTGLPWWRSG